MLLEYVFSDFIVIVFSDVFGKWMILFVGGGCVIIFEV